MSGIDPSHQDEAGLINAINVTPFVDVVLVLLVIFMITAPILVKDIINLQLPKTATSDGQTATTLAIAINKQGSILVNGQVINELDLVQTVATALKETPNLQGVIAADQDVPYGKVMKAIDLLKTAGLQRFAVQIEKQE